MRLSPSRVTWSTSTGGIPYNGAQVRKYMSCIRYRPETSNVARHTKLYLQREKCSSLHDCFFVGTHIPAGSSWNIHYSKSRRRNGATTPSQNVCVFPVVGKDCLQLYWAMLLPSAVWKHYNISALDSRQVAIMTKTKKSNEEGSPWKGLKSYSGISK